MGRDVEELGYKGDAGAQGDGHGGDEAVAPVDAALHGEDAHARDGHVEEQERRHAAQHAVCTVTSMHTYSDREVDEQE